MGLINGSLQIGRSSILASQAALQVIGNNVANAANPDYSRQKPILGAVVGGELAAGVQPGLGVELRTVQRMADNAINARLRTAVSEQSAADAASTVLGQAETIFNALGDDNVSTRLRDLFNAFNELANEPQSSARRTMLLQAGGALARTMNRYRSQLIDERQQVNSQIRTLTEEANRLIQQVAQLNGEITRVEFGLVNATAGTLHDQRDAVLGRLAELMNVTTHTGESGQINVFLGSSPLVLGNDAFGLTTATRTSGEFPDAEVVFERNGAHANITGGQIGGLIQARDGALQNVMDQLDTFASTLIYQVNRLHAQGQGLVALDSATGIYSVDDASAALNAAGLPWSPANGTFQLHVTDQATGARTTHLIQIDLDGIGTDTTLTSLATDIDALVGVSASVNGDGTLTITADTGAKLTFSDDTSGVLGALGINAFFQGDGAGDIAIRSGLTASQIAAASNHSLDDNGNAMLLAALIDRPQQQLNSSSLAEYYTQIVTELASESADMDIEADASASLVQTLQAQRDSVSGVSVDEEAIDLMRYQRAFQGASHYLSLVNQLIGELINLI